MTGGERETGGAFSNVKNSGGYPIDERPESRKSDRELLEGIHRMLRERAAPSTAALPKWGILADRFVRNARELFGRGPARPIELGVLLDGTPACIEDQCYELLERLAAVREHVATDSTPGKRSVVVSQEWFDKLRELVGAKP